MKYFIVLILFVLIAVPLSVSAAPSPAEHQYAMVHCSGMTIDQIQTAEQSFDTQYGWNHQLTTAEQWRSSYTERVNEFADYIGCPKVYEHDNIYTLWYRIYAPRYADMLGGVQ